SSSGGSIASRPRTGPARASSWSRGSRTRSTRSRSAASSSCGEASSATARSSRTSSSTCGSGVSSVSCTSSRATSARMHAVVATVSRTRPRTRRSRSRSRPAAWRDADRAWYGPDPFRRSSPRSGPFPRITSSSRRLAPPEVVMPSTPFPRPDPPRPSLPDGPWAALADRVRVWRSDTRVAVAVLLVAAVVAGVVWYRLGVASGASASDAGAPRAATGPARDRATPTTGQSAASEVVVDVAGAVARPGVVRLPAGSRVVDAIAAAGDAVPGADLARLNLAAKLVDGQHIAVAKVGEPAPVVAGSDGSTGGGGAGGSAGEPTPDAPLDLNTATQAQLEALPGIGPALAQAIIAERTRSGGFRSVSDLRRVRGIGDARFAQLEPLVRV